MTSGGGSGGRKEIAEDFDEVQKADRAELIGFARHKLFKVQDTMYADSSWNMVDAVWARRWKSVMNESGQMVWIVKSRLCGRGFLDNQKTIIQRLASTASRISQRLLISLCVIFQLMLETWDISNAFLQGLTYEQLEKDAKSTSTTFKLADECT